MRLINQNCELVHSKLTNSRVILFTIRNYISYQGQTALTIPLCTRNTAAFFVPLTTVFTQNRLSIKSSYFNHNDQTSSVLDISEVTEDGFIDSKNPFLMLNGGDIQDIKNTISITCCMRFFWHKVSHTPRIHHQATWVFPAFSNAVLSIIVTLTTLFARVFPMNYFSIISVQFLGINCVSFLCESFF